MDYHTELSESPVARLCGSILEYADFANFALVLYRDLIREITCIWDILGGKSIQNGRKTSAKVQYRPRTQGNDSEIIAKGSRMHTDPSGFDPVGFRAISCLRDTFGPANVQQTGRHL